MSLPLVSVVMNTLDGEPAVFRVALDSCLSQMDVEVQLIVSTVPDDPAVAVATEAGGQVAAESELEEVGEGVEEIGNAQEPPNGG